MTEETGRVSMRVSKFLEGRSVEAGAVARLRLEKGRSGTVDRKDTRRMVAVPVGESADPLSLDLVPGDWSVTVDLPWGGTAQQDFEVVAGKNLPLDIAAESSAHESLSWHHFSGAVQGRTRHESPAPLPARDFGRKGADRQDDAADIKRHLDSILARVPAGGLAGLRRSAGFGRAGPGRDAVFGAGEETPGIDVDVPALKDIALNDIADALREAVGSGAQPATVSLSLLEQAQGGALWQDLMTARGEPARSAPLAGLTEISRQEQVFDDIYSIFPVSDFLGAPDKRIWALVEGFGERRLLSIPAPWNTRSGGPAGFEILVRFIEEERGLAQLTIKDEAVAAMLGYMTADRLSDAAVIAEAAKDWLFAKFDNPLAAAGGGYVMLATRLHDEKTEWQKWIRNLNAWFSYLPDGAILEGALCLNGPEEVRDFERAAECFQMAFDRGLPFYTLGLSWLRSGLSTLEADFESLKEPAAIVARIARMAETNRPFTTLRLPSSDP